MVNIRVFFFGEFALCCLCFLFSFGERFQSGNVCVLLQVVDIAEVFGESWKE